MKRVETTGLWGTRVGLEKSACSEDAGVVLKMIVGEKSDLREQAILMGMKAQGMDDRLVLLTLAPRGLAN